MRVLPYVIAPASVLAGILPTFSIPGWSNPSPTTVKATAPAAVTGAPISKPSGISISSVSYSGKGCPSGSVSTSLSADKTVSHELGVPIFSNRNTEHVSGRYTWIRQVPSIHWARHFGGGPLQELQFHPHAQVPTGVLLCCGVQHVPWLCAARRRCHWEVHVDIFLHITLICHIQHEHQRTRWWGARIRVCLYEKRHDIDA